ncbi:MAG TPA: sialate O-acetylesterase, partial [Verrucomicrobium sp.]|nr:sialate O-acetylesterase [Verrucomicrobium sp.]
MKLRFPCLLSAIATASAAASLQAEVTLNALFSDHMVLQRERPLPVWGKADPGEQVAVTFGNETAQATADSSGKWMAILSPKPVSRAGQTLKVKGKTNELAVADILVGDVWLGTGQSNMDWSLSQTDRKDDIVKMPPGTFANIRLFKVAETVADAPVTDAAGKWTSAGTQEILQFSATLFYFAEELQKHQPDVPLGLIRSSVGATNLYSWIPNEVRDSSPAAQPLRTWWGNALKTWTPEKQAQRDKETADYLAAVESYKQRKQPLPEEVVKPGELLGPKWSRRPSALYNGMIAPLQPFAIRGQIWYQGEWDSKYDWVQSYHDLFVAYAQSYRSAWVAKSGAKALGDFPIYLVQLPAREPSDGRYWPHMREVQEKLAKDVPNSGFVVTYDTNDPKELHPREKSPVGKRLAWLALARTYGVKVPWQGPRFLSMKPAAQGLEIAFDTGGGDLKSHDGEPLRGFELA